ncbi:MAG: molybdate ABC transporter substrate-binding protein [Methylococcaceae bacterium]|nr:molybdate ABC transporter substrate-binding protein [Methylococcaceae bacterium]MDZ4156493.1 molybdate ABC transporter substrate-binding protein [Methylococcales bacterium]MDP2391709.1 molybdate ABC transporter substrate-binding protein [Methylococcaceae bacterium]MDP3018210.1 molybdate ABC transporter substrate-binding protein [Methylococcaceae bacterium]MDP3389421.1 molybdate ABC transporter substrate-binding protein [Methylococcaceae bacterium]
MLPSRFFRPFIATWLILLAPTSWAATTLVAVASDFTKPMTEIAAAFEKATGHSAKLSFGSSGKAFAQIQSGAPFEVYLSASEKYPLELEKTGFTVSDTHFVYAIGKLVLWSAMPGYVDDQGKILTTGNFKHVALADPAHAPYGVVAEDVMKSLGVLDKLRPLFVMGENISQTYQFVSTGNAELGFVGLAQVIDVNNGKIGSGSGWIIPDNLHSPFRQMAVLLKTGAENPAALALVDFLKSPTALAIIEKYGFGLPK